MTTTGQPTTVPTTTSTAVGVLGGRWRGDVAASGDVDVRGAGRLRWFVAADDRWHVPAQEPTVRQRRIGGTPVLETRVRIPSGDAVQRVFAVPDDGGLTVVQVENDSPLPIAVAFCGVPLRSARPPATVPIEGIDLPPDTVVFPVGHHATTTVAIAHDGSAAPLGGTRSSADEVAAGWLTLASRAGRLEVPETRVGDGVTAVRCELLLDGPADPADDPLGFVLGVDQLVRMTGDAETWVVDLAEAVHHVLRGRAPGRGGAVLAGEERAAALAAARRVLLAAGEHRAVRDLDRAAPAVTGAGAADGAGAVDDDAGEHVPTDVRSLALLERSLVRDRALLPAGIPRSWWGQSVELHGFPTEGSSTISFALRWHGARPAVLWEQDGDPITLTAPAVAPSWSSALERGEALWPAPSSTDRADTSVDVAVDLTVDPGTSFS